MGYYILQLYDWMIEKTKSLTEHFWKYDPEVDGVRKGKIGLQEFSSVLQSEGMLFPMVLLIMVLLLPSVIFCNR